MATFRPKPPLLNYNYSTKSVIEIRSVVNPLVVGKIKDIHAHTHTHVHAHVCMCMLHYMRI